MSTELDTIPEARPARPRRLPARYRDSNNAATPKISMHKNSDIPTPGTASVTKPARQLSVTVEEVEDEDDAVVRGSSKSFVLSDSVFTADFIQLLGPGPPLRSSSIIDVGDEEGQRDEENPGLKRSRP